MELSKHSIDVSGKRSCLGHCRHFFWLGVVFDTVGMAVVFAGVFADVFYYDMLLYLGSLIIFFSLLWWVSWYSANIELLSDDVLRKSNAHTSFCLAPSLSQGFGHRVAQSQSWERDRPRRRRRQRNSQQRITRPTPSDQMEVRCIEEEKSDDHDQDLDEEMDPKSVEQRSSEGIGSLDPEAAETMHPVLPVLARGPLDLQLPSTVLPSQSLPVFPLASAHQPACTPASCSQMVLPAPSVSRPAVTSAWMSQSSVPRASQSHLLVPTASGSRALLAEAEQSQPLNRYQSSQIQISRVQSLNTQISVVAPVSDQSPQTVGPQAWQSTQNLQAAGSVQQAFKTSSLVQEVSGSPAVPAIPEKAVAQAFETQPLSSQKQSQKLQDTSSPAPKAADPNTDTTSVSSSRGSKFGHISEEELV